MSARVVAIDGPSGAGKSTMARMLAERLGFDYLDTGALYRAVALGLRLEGIEENAQDQRVAEELAHMKVAFRDARVYLNGRDVSGEIRTPEAGHWASVFSARGPVREFLMPVQREAGGAEDLVCEGRDMTTVVFPHAWRKFYLDASVDSRAGRRLRQLRDAGDCEITMERAREDVVLRDGRDSTRDLAPLLRADDAIYIDTSDMAIEEVIEAMLGHCGAGWQCR